ncbi:MAG TPA: hypothetical protein VGO11_11065 [Chthoniobacteraceae bacterium]|jgi:hypothetical protein|nr:hypothetical protein [Chthoniobacteraceae bacterium]
MKTYLFPLVPAMAVAVLLGTPAIAAPALPVVPPIYTNTEQPTLAPIEGIYGQTDAETPNEASPTGAVKNMAPVRGQPLKEELIKESVSGLTVPGAASGSSLGTGINRTLGPATEPEVDPDLFSD